MKFEMNGTKIKGCCQSEKKLVTHNFRSDLPLDVYFDFIYESFFSCQNNLFPAGMEFNFAMPYKNHVYLTTRHSHKLYSFSLSPDGSTDEKDLTLIGEFQYEAQNVCMVESVIYNFSSDQFAYYSTIESYDIESQSFDILFKTEDESLDFSPYFSFGCFPLVKYPRFKL